MRYTSADTIGDCRPEVWMNMCCKALETLVRELNISFENEVASEWR